MAHTISLYNPTELPDIIVSFLNGTKNHFSRNSFQTGSIINITDLVIIFIECSIRNKIYIKIRLMSQIYLITEIRGRN